jgi:hypothetical protein
MSAVKELARRLRQMAREEARSASPPVQRFKVRRANPLVLDEIGGDLLLEEGDEDVELARELAADRPSVGETVRVHRDAEGDYIVSGVIT